ncbi:MAG TPA: hypothetical protein PK417_15630 [Hyphomonas sp.]|nr:hypothetical protein [Hyphomonas sp.]HRX73116.1 hypothetical protein [Hyphomonas sp.]
MNEHADTAKYLCTKCRRTFKRQVWLTELQSQHRRVNRNLPDATCPNCGHTAVWIGPRYRAPKASDVKTWKIIEFLESVGELALLRSGPPPQNLQEAQDLVERVRNDRITAFQRKTKANPE